MPKDGHITERRSQSAPPWTAALLCAFALLPTLPLQADVWQESFESIAPDWEVQLPSNAGRVLHRAREETVPHEGRYERVQLAIVKSEVTAAVGRDVPLAHALDELTIALWVRCDRPGPTLAVRVVFPEFLDPSTGQAAAGYIHGGTYAGQGTWQQITCRTSDRELARLLSQIRSRLGENGSGHPGEPYVDRVALFVNSDAGTTDLSFDELQISPYLPAKPSAIGNAGTGEGLADRPAPMEFRLDRLQVEGRPFFPRMITGHGEPLSVFKDTRLNTIWIPDVTDKAMLGALRREGLWAAATPPRPARPTTGASLTAGDASLLPFGDDTAAILFWMMGTRIGPEQHEVLVDWVQQIQQADRRWNRPVAGDVFDSERQLSRHLNMLGISRHMLNSSLTFQGYREWLTDHRTQARPGTLCWTWLQTEPAPLLVEQCAGGQHAPTLEAEQLWLQAYTAIIAGCRGLGYWTTDRLDDETTPHGRERRLAIEILNLELSLLEPWLATGKAGAPINFTLAGPQGAVVDQRNTGFGAANGTTQDRRNALRDRESRERAARVRNQELVSGVIRSNLGTLLLPVWLERHAQFCPGQLAGNDATFVVPGAGESAAAFEITTTGIRSLESDTQRVGGMHITLRKFDVRGAILLTSDRDLVRRLEAKAGELAEPSARATVELARLKLGRVRQVDQELRALGNSWSDAPMLLGRADRLLEQATEHLRNQDWSAARLRAADSMQLCRILQRGHWEDAVRVLASPASSPFTMCFETLPDHWRMLKELGRGTGEQTENLLPTGQFDDVRAWTTAGWKHLQADLPTIQCGAELQPGGYRQSPYSLRMVAAPYKDQPVPEPISRPLVSLISPPIEVKAGQLVHISGFVRVPRSIVGSPDGLVIFDNLLGKTGALRFHEAQEWGQFELVREIHETGSLTVNLALHGLGSAEIDQLKVVAIDPIHAAPVQPVAGEEPEGRPERFSGLPRWSSLRGRK